MTPGMNMSVELGQCPRKGDCDYMFKIYMTLSVVGSFISACGGTPGYIVLLRLVTLKLKELTLLLVSHGYNDTWQCSGDFVLVYNGNVSTRIKLGALCDSNRNILLFFTCSSLVVSNQSN